MTSHANVWDSNECPSASVARARITRLVLAATCVVLILGVTTNFSLAASNTDKNIDSVRVSLNVENVSLRQAIQMLMSQTRFEIVFNDEHLHSITVSCAFQNISLRKAMGNILQDTGLEFHALADGQIVILAKKAKIRSITGFVYDARNLKPLSHANVTLKGTRLGTISDERGRFDLIYGGDSDTLLINYLGFQQALRTLSSETSPIVVLMAPDIILGPEVIFTAAQSSQAESARGPSQLQLSARQIAVLPSAGHADLFRSLLFMPGIAATSGGQTNLFIRGGTPDQNLVLYDGMPIYPSQSAFRFMSAINTDAIDHIRVYKGGYPAKFGGRTSSVVEMTSKLGDDRLRLDGGLSLVGGQARMQVPIAEKGSWFVSFRRSYTHPLSTGAAQNSYGSFASTNPLGGRFLSRSPSRTAPGQSSRPDLTFRGEALTPELKYSDLNTRLNYSVSGNDRISLSYFVGRDKLNQAHSLGYTNSAAGQDPAMEAGGIVRDITAMKRSGISLNWSRAWSRRLSSRIQIGATVSENENATIINSPWDPLPANPTMAWTGPQAASASNRIHEQLLRFDNKWSASASHRVEFGTWLSRTSIGLLVNEGAARGAVNQFARADKASAYLQDSWRPAESVELIYGLHVSHYGPTQKSYYEPRASFKKNLARGVWLKGAWGHYNQFVNRVSAGNDIQTRHEFWMLANGEGRPTFAEHKILGVNAAAGDFLFDVELYRKDLRGIAEFARQSPGLPAGQDLYETVTGNGVAQGIEFLVQRTRGKLQGWMSYALSRVSYRFDELNRGVAFPADQNRTHELKFAGQYQAGRWHLGATWVLASGAPYSLPETGARLQSRYGVALLRNGRHLPTYHQLDLSLFRRFDVGRLYWDFGVSFLNVYNHKNIWNRDMIPGTRPALIRDVTSMPFTPTISVKVGF